MQARLNRAQRKAYIAAARRIYQIDGEIEVDDNARIVWPTTPAHFQSGKGFYVKAWLWVAHKQVGTAKQRAKLAEGSTGATCTRCSL